MGCGKGSGKGFGKHDDIGEGGTFFCLFNLCTFVQVEDYGLSIIQAFRLRRLTHI